MRVLLPLAAFLIGPGVVGLLDGCEHGQGVLPSFELEQGCLMQVIQQPSIVLFLGLHLHLHPLLVLSVLDDFDYLGADIHSAHSFELPCGWVFGVGNRRQMGLLGVGTDAFQATVQNHALYDLF